MNNENTPGNQPDEKPQESLHIGINRNLEGKLNEYIGEIFPGCVIQMCTETFECADCEDIYGASDDTDSVSRNFRPTGNILYPIVIENIPSGYDSISNINECLARICGVLASAGVPIYQMNYKGAYLRGNPKDISDVAFMIELPEGNDRSNFAILKVETHEDKIKITTWKNGLDLIPFETSRHIEQSVFGPEHLAGHTEENEIHPGTGEIVDLYGELAKKAVNNWSWGTGGKYGRSVHCNFIYEDLYLRSGEDILDGPEAARGVLLTTESKKHDTVVKQMNIETDGGPFDEDEQGNLTGLLHTPLMIKNWTGGTDSLRKCYFDTVSDFGANRVSNKVHLKKGNIEATAYLHIEDLGDNCYKLYMFEEVKI